MNSKATGLQKRIFHFHTSVIFMGFILASMLFSLLAIQKPTQVYASTGNTYYISTSGSDSNPGTQASPWLTIQKAANSMVAGDTTNVMAGDYSTQRVQMTTSGSSGKPITFLAQGSVTMKGFTVKANYVDIIGFYITNTDNNDTNGWGIFYEGSNCLISNNHVYYATRGGIILYTDPSNFTETANCTVSNNKLERNSQVGIEVHGRNNLIEDNEVWGSIQYHPAWINPPSWVDADGMRFFGQGHIFRGNYIHDIDYGIPENVNPHIDCFQTFTSDYAEAASNILFEQNDCVEPTYQALVEKASAFTIENGSNITIRNNVLEAFLIVYVSNGSAITVENNLIEGQLSYPSTLNPGGILLSNSPSCTILNNIFYNMPGYTLYAGDTSSQTGLTAGYSWVYWNNGQSASGTAYTNDTFNVDPKFVDPSNGNFHISSSSPLINTGITISGLINDHDSVTRPQPDDTKGIDIGPYEYVATSISTPTTAATTAVPTATATATVTSTRTPTATLTKTTVPPTVTTTSIPPTSTSKPTATATMTSVPPTGTNTLLPPTSTSKPTATATITSVPPTVTNTLLPPTSTNPATSTNTPISPTVTNIPLSSSSTNVPTVTATTTSVPATVTNTLNPPTSTNVAATATMTVLPPTVTNTPVPSTSTSPATATNTPISPTVTNIPLSASSTNMPTVTATMTSVPPTVTNTLNPPTSTNVPAASATKTALPSKSTNTPVPPTSTSLATITNTPVPPTTTSTPLPPTATSTPVTPTSTYTALPATVTSTLVPPTMTKTALPPTATNTTAPTSTNTATPTTATTSTKTPTATKTSIAPTATTVSRRVHLHCTDCMLANSSWPMAANANTSNSQSSASGPVTPKLNWSMSIGTSTGTIPVLDAQNNLFIGSGSSMVSITSTGLVNWTATTGGSVTSPILTQSGDVYFGSADGNLYSVDSSTGQVLWTFQTADAILSAPGISSDGVIYVPSTDGTLYALNYDGSIYWTYTVGSPIQSTPAVLSDGTVIFGAINGNIYALNSDGSFAWSYATDGSIITSPAVNSANTILISSSTGTIYAISNTGTLLWSDKVGGTLSNPAIDANGNVYFGSNDQNIYAFSSSGTLKWTYKLGGASGSPVIGNDGTIYIGSQNGTLTALQSDGTLLWSMDLGGSAAIYPVIGSGNTLYAVTGMVLKNVIEATSPVVVYRYHAYIPEVTNGR